MPPIRLLAAAVLTACCSSVIAQAIPAGVSGLYGARVEACFGSKCESGYADTILISPLGRDHVRVDISLLFQNGEQCDVEKATGIWRDRHLLVEIEGPPSCKLHLHFSRGRVKLRDDLDAPCVRIFCGFNGSLNATLPKKGNL